MRLTYEQRRIDLGIVMDETWRAWDPTRGNGMHDAVIDLLTKHSVETVRITWSDGTGAEYRLTGVL